MLLLVTHVFNLKKLHYKPTRAFNAHNSLQKLSNCLLQVDPYSIITCHQPANVWAQLNSSPILEEIVLSEDDRQQNS